MRVLDYHEISENDAADRLVRAVSGMLTSCGLSALQFLKVVDV